MAHAAAAQAAIANAIKANGVLVSVTPEDFDRILSKSEKPLVISSIGGILRTYYQYLTSYKGLTFFAKSSEQIDLPRGVEVIVANKIWMPS